MTVNYKVVARCCGSGGVRTSCRRVIVMFDDFYTARRGSKVSGAVCSPRICLFSGVFEWPLAGRYAR